MAIDRSLPTYLEDEYRQLFRNILTTDRIVNLDVEGWMRYCRRVGATSVFLDAKGHAWAYYPSAWVPHDPRLQGRDLVGEFKHAAERYGLKWGLYLAPCQTDSLTSRGQDWQQRTADGTVPQTDSWCRTFFCWNAPGHRELLSNVIRELAERYRPQGFYIDGIYFDHRACYCAACRAQYRAATGRELPGRPPDWESPDWFEYVRWRHQCIAEAARWVQAAAHAVDPRITVVANCPYAWCGWYAAQSAAQARWLDLVGTEAHRAWGADLRGPQTLGEYMAWLVGANRMLKGGKKMHLYTWVTPAQHVVEVETWNDIALAAGALPCFQEECRFIKRIFARTRQAEPYLRGAVAAADVALHVSSVARDVYYRPEDGPGVAESERGVFNDRGFFREVRGWFTGLLRIHQAVEPVHLEDGLEDTELSGFRLVILPNSVYLSPRVSERLRDYVAAGGAVLATMETGLRDINGRRSGGELLWPGSGLRFRAEIRTVVPWRMRHDAEGNVTEVEGSVPASPDQYLVFAEGTRFWLGEDVRLGPRPDGVEVREALHFPDAPSCHLPAPAVEVAVDDAWRVRAQLRFRRTKERGWEECPAVAVRRWGRGRICYLNFQLGTLLFTTGHRWWRHLLARVLHVAAAGGPLQVQAPSSVKVFAWRQPAAGRYVVHLVNELSSSGLLDLQREDRVPVSATVRIGWPGVRAVRKVVGSARCVVRRVGGRWVVQLSGLEDRVILVCEQERPRVFGCKART